MNEFRAYIPGMWQVDGLLTEPERVTPSNIHTSKAKRITKTVAVACMFTVAVVTVSFRMSGYEMQSPQSFSSSRGGAGYSASLTSDDVPAGYWNSLITTLQRAPLLQYEPSDDNDLPDPLI